MNILSIDVGMKYLGFCLFNIKDGKFSITKWDTINLCNEINLYTCPDEVAVCNLASICLPKFINRETLLFDFEKLRNVVKVVTKNLNKVIDVNYYPIPEARNSNLKHRPIGIGIQGLADVFCILRMAFDSPEAKKLNRQIAEHMYLAGVEASMEIAKKRTAMITELLNIVDHVSADWQDVIIHKADNYIDNIQAIEFLLNYDIIRGKYKQEINDWRTADQLSLTIGAENSGLSQFSESQIALLSQMKRLFDLQKILKLIPPELNREKCYGAYSSFIGSPLEKGKLQYDLWGVEPSSELKQHFENVKQQIQQYGLRNSTLFAYMPTASTSQIQGNNECFEPYTYNIYTRKVLSGQHRVINKHLVNDLLQLGLWNKEMKDIIIAHGGSVQKISEIPNDIKILYKTVWEISQKVLIDYATDRGPFICQTQSMNLFLSDPTYGKMTSMHFYAWRKGLKTGMYYLRTRTKANAQQVTVDPNLLKKIKNKEVESKTDSIPIDGFVCSRDNPDCEACGA